MTFIEENLPLITLIGFTLVSIVLIIILRYNIYMSNFFSNRKFRINSAYIFEPVDKSKTFSLTIFNNNVNDSRMISFGFLYKNHSINYYRAYLNDNKLGENHKIIIASRDCISVNIDALEFKRVISDMNRGSRRVSKLKAYVADSSGLTFKANAKAVKKQIALLIKIDYLKDQEEKRLIREELAKEKRAKRKKRQIERQIKNKESLEKFKLKLKKIFTFRKKKA